MLYAFLILAPTDGFCLADKKGSMLDLGQFPKVSQVYIVLHQQVPLRVLKIRAFPSRSTEWYSFPKMGFVSNLYPDKLSQTVFVPSTHRKI